MDYMPLFEWDSSWAVLTSLFS